MCLNLSWNEEVFTVCFAEVRVSVGKRMVNWNPIAVLEFAVCVLWSQTKNVAFDGAISPVLKHGPGSPTCPQVFG